MSGTLHPSYGSLPWHTDGFESFEVGVADRSGRTVCYVSTQRGMHAPAVARLIAAAPTLEARLREAAEALALARIGGAQPSMELLDRIDAALAPLEAKKVQA